MKQLNNESDAAFSAFLAYYATGGIGLKEAYKYYCQELGQNAEDEDSLLPDVWHIWNQKYRWDDRLLDQEDGDTNFTVEQLAKSQHDRIIDFRNRQIKINQELSKTTRLLLKRVRTTIARLDPKEIPPSAIPNFINSVARIVELSAKSETEQLAINDLIDALQQVDVEKPKQKFVSIDYNFEELV